MKTALALFFTLILFFASNCMGAERTLNTPADRLVGHWSTKSGDNLYFGKLRTDGMGSYILVQPDGNTAFHQYKIISLIPRGERVIVQLNFSDDNKRNATYFISKDGKHLESTSEIVGMKITTQLEYVDTKEKP